MNTTVITYEDLKDDEMVDLFTGADFTISLLGHQPAILGRRKIYSDNLTHGS